jgi:uncharacterized phage protein (TIGR01671 family)
MQEVVSKMREIKFRAWNGKEMISPDYINRYGLAAWSEDGILNLTDKVMQYIGLHDKNGKEIYEGDVIAYDGYETITDYFEVYWDDELGLWAMRGDVNKDGILFELQMRETNPEITSVIGNIYENPELLGGDA